MVKNPIERGLFPLTEDQKERFISNSKDALNKAIHRAILSFNNDIPLLYLEDESELIERHSSELVEYMSNLVANKYTKGLEALIKTFANDLSNLFTDEEL